MDSIWTVLHCLVSHRNHVAGRFNERLVLSLASNPACILMDDELNILPTSSHVANIKPLPRDDDGACMILSLNGRSTVSSSKWVNAGDSRRNMQSRQLL